MAVSNKSLNDALRNKYLEIITKVLTECGEEVLVTNSNEVTIPCVDANGNDKFAVFTIKIPTGSRDGEAYDGYALAEEYKAKQAEKIAKAQASAEAKAKKIARDKKNREKLAKSKADYHAE